MTKQQIILETVEFYKNNPRSMGKNNSCLYLGPNGEKCAFSRCCTQKSITNILVKENDTPLAFMRDINVDDILLKKYQGHDKSFWHEVQAIHDAKEFWKGKIFLKAGRTFVNFLLKKYV